MFGSDRMLAAALVLLGAAGDVVSAAPTAGPPSLIVVPEPLARRSATLEPSGVVWAAKLNRYLVVSDDTGNPLAHHEPWVLAMTADGAFDPEPVPVWGIDRLNDAESICQGPDGLFFVTTSHSLNKRGRRRRARDMVLLLGLEGRALRVLGRVNLTKARDSDGSGSLLKIAGLPTDGLLDIEALTFREGALYLGLKSPLSTRDGAVIVRLASPVEALRAGHLSAGAVTRAWELTLAGDARGVPEGIADLATLPDGRLAVLANSPKGREHDRGGSLYWFEPSTGRVTFVHQWPGLHPEGVTLSSDGGALVILFDANTDPPLWTRWPLPARGVL